MIVWTLGDRERLDSIRYVLLKSQYEQLLAEWSEVKDQVRQLDLLRRRVTPFDPRTGWHSHAHIIDRCQEEIARALRYSLPIALWWWSTLSTWSLMKAPLMRISPIHS